VEIIPSKSLRNVTMAMWMAEMDVRPPVRKRHQWLHAQTRIRSIQAQQLLKIATESAYGHHNPLLHTLPIAATPLAVDTILHTIHPTILLHQTTVVVRHREVPHRAELLREARHQVVLHRAELLREARHREARHREARHREARHQVVLHRAVRHQ
jgi:hypothetical protein